MNSDDIRNYARRDWNLIADLDRRHWAEEYQRFGSSATVEASKALWAHMKAIRPDWPTEQDRERDLEHHIEFKRRLDEASRRAAG